MSLPYIRPRLFVATLLVSTACSAPEQRDYQDETPIEIPEAFTSADASAPLPSLERWWEDFGDPNLSQAVERVLDNNFDLAAAAARVRAAEAQARIAGADLQPGVGVGFNAGRQRQNFVGLPIPGGGSEVLSSTSSNFGLSLDVSWELDLWGKLDARAQAGAAELGVSTANYHGARLSLAGQAIKTWLALSEVRQQLEIAAARVESVAGSTETLRERFGNGRLQALDLRLSEVQLATARAAYSNYEQSLERVTRELEILLGEYPTGAMTGAAELPALPPASAAGLPSELLQRRPDLVAARETLRASDYRLYAARKELWPSLSLGVGAGRNSSELEDLLDNDFSVWSLLGNLTQPIFQGGRIDANIDLSEASVQANLAEYGQAILRAFLEVETVLATEQSLERKEQFYSVAAEHATSAQALAEERYFAGRGDILTMLSARTSAFDNQSAWLSARRERLEQRVDLYLAVGGGMLDTNNGGVSLPAISSNDNTASGAGDTK